MHGLLQTNPDDTSPWLSPAEIALVRTQFAYLQHDADAFAADVCNALFSRTPHLRTIFHGDMPQHRAKFMQMLAILVAKLHQSEAITEQLAWLGLEHRCYGVLALDYDRMGEALMHALSGHLGTAFHASSRTAWSKAYVFIASSMQSAQA